MAVEEAKAAGWDIQTVLADSKCDAQEAANAANKLITEDGVKFIIGEVCSSASIPISEIVEKAKVLQISPTSTNPAVTVNEDGSVKQYVFRACFLDPFQGEVVAALAKELGAKKAAVLFDVGNDYVKGLAEYFKASFEEMGGQVPVYEAYTKDDTDFSGILGKVAAANVDVVFLPDYYNKNNLIAAQIKEKGIKAILLGGDGWDSPELQFDLFEGGYFSNHYSPADPRPLVQNFVKQPTKPSTARCPMHWPRWPTMRPRSCCSPSPRRAQTIRRLWQPRWRRSSTKVSRVISPTMRSTTPSRRRLSSRSRAARPSSTSSSLRNSDCSQRGER